MKLCCVPSDQHKVFLHLWYSLDNIRNTPIHKDARDAEQKKAGPIPLVKSKLFEISPFAGEGQ
jgi:hypothetical protein